MTNVIELDVVTSLPIPVDRILKKALDAKMTEVVIIGFDEDGEFFFASSVPDAGNVLYHLEFAKHNLMKACDLDD